MILLKKNLKGFLKLSKLAVTICLTCISLFSCKSPALVSPSGESDFSKYLFKKLNSSGKEIISFDQMDISIDDGDVKSFKANLYISRGDFIYANINFLGFELARIQLSPDSIKIINRLEKSYFFTDFANLYNLTGIALTYSQVESLILNGLICDELQNFKRFKQYISVDSLSYKFSFRGLDKYVINSYFSKSTYVEEKIEISNIPGSIILKAELNKYSEDGVYPKLINIQLKKDNLIVDVAIQLNKIGKDKPTNRSFLINSKYREMEF